MKVKIFGIETFLLPPPTILKIIMHLLKEKKQFPFLAQVTCLEIAQPAKQYIFYLLATKSVCTV